MSITPETAWKYLRFKQGERIEAEGAALGLQPLLTRDLDALDMFLKHIAELS